MRRADGPPGYLPLHPKLLIATLLALIAVIVVVIILTIGRGGSSPRRPSGQAPTQRPRARTPATSTVTVPNPNYHPSYAKHLPASPFDQQYASQVDASGQAIAAVEAVNPAKPGWTRAFPKVPAAPPPATNFPRRVPARTARPGLQEAAAHRSATLGLGGDRRGAAPRRAACGRSARALRRVVQARGGGQESQSRS